MLKGILKTIVVVLHADMYVQHVFTKLLVAIRARDLTSQRRFHMDTRIFGAGRERALSIFSFSLNLSDSLYGLSALQLPAVNSVFCLEPSRDGRL
jgi:hypothetical protein